MADCYSSTILIAGKAAIEFGAEKFVYVSTACVYKSDKSPTKESGKLEPWTTPARFQLEAEKVFSNFSSV